MKGLILCVLLAVSFNIYSDEVGFEKDGAILWAENCMGCHIPRNFLAANPDPEYVNELIEEIDYNIYDPESGMNVLTYLKRFEIEKIAAFLIYGSHGEKWAAENLHSSSAVELGTDSCIKCHDNSNFYKNPPPSCNACH